MDQQNSNDSVEQKKAKNQNQNKQGNKIFGNKHTTGPNHPST